MICLLISKILDKKFGEENAFIFPNDDPVISHNLFWVIFQILCYFFANTRSQTINQLF